MLIALKSLDITCHEMDTTSGGKLMKKLLAGILVTMFLFSSAFADAYYLAVPAYYAMWAKSLFGIEVDEKITTSRKDDWTVTSMDKITTYTNRQTMDVEKISLYFYDTNVYYTEKMEDERIGRLLSFFYAIEGGNFFAISNEETQAVMENVTKIITTMDNLSDDFYRRIWNKEMVSFYTSEKGTYYEHLEYSSRYYVDFIPGEKNAEQSDTEPSLSSIMKKQDEWKSKFESVVKSRMKEYYDTALDDFKLTYSSEEDAVQAMNVYFIWSAKNGTDMTKKMLQMFSDDLAATIHNEYPKIPIERLTIFWRVPYHSEAGYAAKYQYKSEGSRMYLQNSLGLLYGKE